MKKEGFDYKLIVTIAIILLCGLLFFLFWNNYEKEVDQEEKITVAFSYAEKNNPRLTAIINSFESVAEAKDLELVYYEPREYTNQGQFDDISRILTKDIDYLVLMPRNTAVINDVIELTKEKNIPIILLSGQISEENEENLVSVINTDFVKEGMICAQILAEKYEGEQCRIIEISGIEGSTIAMERASGFRAEIDKYENMTIVESIQGDFNRLTAKESMSSIIVSRNGGFEAVFAHSDEDGLGALNAMKVSGYLENHNVEIVSVNGTQDVIKAIIADEYLATVQSSAKLGQVVYDIIGQMERGFTPSKMVVMPYAIIDETNAEEQLSLTY